MIIPIWAPRWHDRVVLVSKGKVTDDNTIKFTKCSIWGHFYLTGDEIRGCPLEWNGKIWCYAIPLDLVLSKSIDIKNEKEYNRTMNEEDLARREWELSCFSDKELTTELDRRAKLDWDESLYKDKDTIDYDYSGKPFNTEDM